ncbi:MAG: ABC transporter ATP-binding protein/permease [Bacteroidia bacterium]|jgi:ATP-binding cassette subfamily B multidrug efflux pump|nr:ABC transporter ATP-binding protein/permease [Bacteroidia bacterium]
MSVSGAAFDFTLLKRVLHYVKPWRKLLVGAIGLTITMAFISPIRPLLIQYAVDHFILTPEPTKLLWITLLMVGVLLIESAGQFFSAYITNKLGQYVIRDLRNDVYGHISRMKTAYFDKSPIGSLVTRVVSDIETIASIFTEGIVILFGDILQLLVVLIVMFAIDWQLTLISISTIPLLLIATNIFKNGIKSAFQDVRTQVAHINTFVQEHISGMNVVQIFNREEEELKRFKVINRAHTKAHIRSVWHYSVFFPITEILSAVSLGLLIWLGARGVISGTFTIGNLVAFTMFVGMLFRPIRMLADRFNTLQMGMVSSERVFQVLDTFERIDDTGKLQPAQLKGDIEFKDVSMWYSPDVKVLDGLSFKVKAGSTIAIVGATGAGKTSIINLINRSYEFQQGEILIDGHPIRDYQIQCLRNHIAIVLQDVFLFSDTIANNISLGDTQISREAIEAAAKKVGADAFIKKLPGGYDFNVMERGGMLSAGQRQLIAFIRAYLFNPEILVLDEATSSVDIETEMLIQEAMDALTKNRTAIIIAHRLSTIQKADQIFVMEKGRLIESGTHQELLALEGQYKRLYELQFGAESA